MSDGIPMVECPAGVCQKSVATIDHDSMFGHLLSVHRWTFDTSQEWVIENMASEEEARELEERWLLSIGSDDE